MYGTSSHNTNYVAQVNGILNLKQCQNRVIGSKVRICLLNGWILPIVEVALGWVCAACEAGLF